MWNVKKPSFLVDFDPSSSSESLKIPPKYAKHVDGTTLGIAFLLGPSGNTWHANLVRQDGDFFFQDGWAAFVKDHSLESGDSLVFRYNGSLHFTVQIFDQTSCEKETAFCSECSQDLSNSDNHIVKKRARENSTLLDCIIEGIPKRTRSAQHRDLGNKNGCLEEEAGSLDERTQGKILYAENNRSSALKSIVTVAVPSEENVAFESPEATISNRTSKEELLLSAPEAERVARAFTSSFPNFMKVMKRFNISGSYTLNVPYQFATAHLPNCKVKIVLHNLKGESWIVNSIPTTRVQTSHTFCGGWLSFVRDNNINMGDICIFELVHKCELQVHIIRVTKEGMEDCNEKGIHKTKVDGSCSAVKKISRRKSKKINVKSSNDSLQWLTKVDKKGHGHDRVKFGSALKSSPISSQSISRELVIWEPGSQGRLGSHTKGCVSMKSAPEEKVAAQSFVSSFPHFVRIMKKFNVSGSYTLKIPYQFARENLPDCRTEITLRNLKGKCWTVNSIPTTKVQTLHTFCGGWMAFVRDNDIQMGDICIFELVDKQEMRVHIFRNSIKGIDYQTGRGSS